MDFNCSMKLIKLRQTLSVTMGSPDIYMREKVPQDIYETIVKFAELRKLDRANLVRDFDLYPDVVSLLNMERKYGDAIYYEDINGSKKRRRKRNPNNLAGGNVPDGSI
jgi:hypothetical protein